VRERLADADRVEIAACREVQMAGAGGIAEVRGEGPVGRAVLEQGGRVESGQGLGVGAVPRGGVVYDSLSAYRGWL